MLRRQDKEIKAEGKIQERMRATEAHVRDAFSERIILMTAIVLPWQRDILRMCHIPYISTVY
jgi:hypothetical protein